MIAPSAALRGTTLGRYVIEETVGSGGMGVVHAARDPELDRKVALKVLRADRWSAADGSEGKARLLREAQALARLAHPNVITVHDVGTVGDEIFIAMEFVAGGTLLGWLAKRVRTWREILPPFIAAGRGLAAAHAAGLVHRDFKPENVLIGDDGRVLVTDFGLARPVGDLVAAGERGPASPALSATITLTDELMGTLAYMSPEQLGGLEMDARSDQFSFCAALFEALYRVLPSAAQTGEPLVVPAGAAVPAWVRRVVERGLAFAPADRFPSMAALLEALGRDPALARRRWIFAGAAFLVVAGAVALVVARPWRSPACQGSEARLAGVWDSTRRGAVETAFAATQVPYAPAAWAKVAPLLDERAAAWVKMRTATCLATERGEQSPQLLDTRMECLDARLAEMTALTDLFVKADADVVEHAIDAVDRVGDLDSCIEGAAMVPPPTDQASRLRLTAARQKLALGLALLASGKFKEALAPAQAAADEAHALGWAPFDAEALYALAEVHDKIQQEDEASRLLRASARAALAAKHDVALAMAWSVLVEILANDHAHMNEALQAAEDARAAIDRISGEDRARAEINVHGGLAMVYLHDGKFREAVAEDEAALAVATPYPKAAADILARLAESEIALGEKEKALGHAQAALAIEEQLLGPFHPDVATMLNSLGHVQFAIGHLDGAAATYRRSLAIREATIGHDTPLTASTYNNLGNVLATQERRGEALEAFRESLAIKEKHLPPDHPAIGGSLANIGMIEEADGKLDDALATFRRALAIAEKAYGASHLKVVQPLVGVGSVLLRQRPFAEAASLFERALAIRLANQGTPLDLAKLRYGLAQALWGSGVDKKRALALARQAKLDFVAAESDEAADVDAWLAKHK